LREFSVPFRGQVEKSVEKDETSFQRVKRVESEEEEKPETRDGKRGKVFHKQQGKEKMREQKMMREKKERKWELCS